MLASTANEVTERKTIQSHDVIKALREIEMDQVMQIGVMAQDGKRGGRVEREVEMWESEVRGKRRGYRERVKARESGAGDTTMGSVDVAADDEEHETKRQRIDINGDGARDSSTGPITHGTNNIKLNVGRRRSDDERFGDDGGDEDAVDESSEEEVFEDAEEDQDEAQVEDDVDVDDETSRRKGALAPDGRVEVGDSGDESE